MEDKLTRRILLVDDDLSDLLSLKAALEISGFEVDTALSAAEASSRLNSSRYHTVITDMRMEDDQAGLLVIQQAKKADYDPALAILTAHPVNRSKCREEGARCW